MDTSSTLRVHARDLVHAQARFHGELVDARVRSGMSVMEVAERMGVTEDMVTAFEHYDADPTFSQVRRYALAVGVGLVWEVDAGRVV